MFETPLGQPWALLPAPLAALLVKRRRCDCWACWASAVAAAFPQQKGTPLFPLRDRLIGDHAPTAAAALDKIGRTLAHAYGPVVVSQYRLRAAMATLLPAKRCWKKLKTANSSRDMTYESGCACTRLQI